MENHIWNCFTICIKYYYNSLSLQLPIINPILEDFGRYAVWAVSRRRGRSVNMNDSSKGQQHPGIAENRTPGRVLGEVIQRWRTWVSIQASILTTCMTLSKWISFPGPPFSHLQVEGLSNDTSIAWAVSHPQAPKFCRYVPLVVLLLPSRRLEQVTQGVLHFFPQRANSQDVKLFAGTLQPLRKFHWLSGPYHLESSPGGVSAFPGS